MLALSCIIMSIYFWRLLASSLPARDLIISCFIPMGPTGEGAYSIQNLAVGLGTYIQKSNYLLSRGPHKQATTDMIAAVAESINWLGVIIALFLMAFSTFWLVQATGSVILRIPKRFNVGFWSFVFPFAVYTNALCRLAQDLNNPGFRGWAATCTIITLLLWLSCALMTLWKGVWKGQLFFAPGLEGWTERRASEERSKEEYDGGEKQTTGRRAGTDEMSNQAANADTTRTSRPDGTYSLARWRRRSSAIV
ncbi:MAG: hypothetical protein M1822_005329 [Bathelium mastoideum]|nr:MAG: hypothetical protein M1822_005329 [Bathelium mastoideum]